MVFVNNKKYACATCIKGHRSSSCGHTERALFEIKKKGRPVTQCDHCRQLRRTKQVHVKCMCEAGGEDAPDNRVREGEVSMYPNGVQDILASVSVSVPYPVQTSRLESILNPCKCRQGEPCNCCTPRNSVSARDDPPTDNPSSCCSGATSDSTMGEPSSPEGASRSCCSPDSAVSCEPRCSCAGAQKKKKGGCCGSAKSPVKGGGPSLSRPVSSHASMMSSDTSDSATLSPFSMSSPSSSSPHQVSSSAILSTSAMAPLQPLSPSQIMDSTADFSRCNCGWTCACPGCTEHNPSSASTVNESCPTSCTTCLDCIGGYTGAVPAAAASYGLSSFSPYSSNPAYTSSPGQSAIDAFLERQAAIYGLPPAPLSRANVTRLDGSSTFVLPPSARTDPGGPAARASGITNVRRMVCCQGRCACAEGRCGCDDNCQGERGCAGHHGHASGPSEHDSRLQTSSPFSPGTTPTPFASGRPSIFHSPFPFSMQSSPTSYRNSMAPTHQSMPLSTLQQSLYSARVGPSNPFTNHDPFSPSDPSYWSTALRSPSR